MNLAIEFFGMWKGGFRFRIVEGASLVREGVRCFAERADCFAIKVAQLGVEPLFEARQSQWQSGSAKVAP